MAQLSIESLQTSGRIDVHRPNTPQKLRHKNRTGSVGYLQIITGSLAITGYTKDEQDVLLLAAQKAASWHSRYGNNIISSINTNTSPAQKAPLISDFGYIKSGMQTLNLDGKLQTGTKLTNPAISSIANDLNDVVDDYAIKAAEAASQSKFYAHESVAVHAYALANQITNYLTGQCTQHDPMTPTVLQQAVYKTTALSLPPDITVTYR